MRIENLLDRPISYELKGGPLRMTMSTCDLEPGEHEVWESPYKVQQLDISCELHVLVGDLPLVQAVSEDALVQVVDQGSKIVLKVSG